MDYKSESSGDVADVSFQSKNRRDWRSDDFGCFHFLCYCHQMHLKLPHEGFQEIVLTDCFSNLLDDTLLKIQHQEGLLDVGKKPKESKSWLS